VADDRDAVGGGGHPGIWAARDAFVAGQNMTIYVASDQPEAAGPTQASELRSYLERLAASYRWLELRGIPGSETLRIELEQVYVALRTEPETSYDLLHLANLHATEVEEAAGGIALHVMDRVRLAELDAENIRRTHRPRQEEARLACVTDVTDIAAAVRRHRRIIILGGAGSGKTTLGRWLALQFARQLLRQAPDEVAPEPADPGVPVTARLHVEAGTTISFSADHFVPPDQSDTTAIGIGVLPERGRLKLRGAPVVAGQAIGVNEIGLLTYTPAGTECGGRYAYVRFTAGGRTISRAARTVVLDVATHVRVPVSQVDPDRQDEAGSGELTDLGPARVPIFLRLADFARELAEREAKEEPAPSLEDYFGRDPDSGKRADGCTAESRNALLRAALEDGRALVILDGLDELPEANRRAVLPPIQEFIEARIGPNTVDGAADAAAPDRADGNQVIVTSRYDGYKAMPIRSACAHFGIQSMQQPAVERFVRSWSAAVNAELNPQVQRRLSPEKLIAEIYDDTRPAIRDLAANPLLITILAIVYWTDGKLPDQRAGLYDRVVSNLLLIWINRPECQAQLLLCGEVLAALEPLAADMQADGSRLVGLTRIAQLIEEPLARARKTAPADPAFRPVLDALLMAVKKHVGLLAEQSDDNYAFFHRTFQEFLAARHLLADQACAAANIVGQLDDPLWREPLLLALGLAMISSDWDKPPQARARLLEDVLAADDQDAPIPRAAMLVMSALPDLKDVPQPVLERLIGQLLSSYALSQGQSQAAGLRESIRDAFAGLHRGPQAGPAAAVIAAAINRPAAEQDYAAAAAEILLRVGWFTTEIVDALLRAAHRDQAWLGWPVRWALVAALGQSATGLPAADGSPAEPAPALDISRLVTTHLPMRQLLESRPDLTAAVRGDDGWLWLMVALYGGLGQVRALDQRRAHQHRRLRELWDASDSAANPPPPVPPVEFSPGDIVYDLADQELSSAIADHLQAREPAGALAAAFRRVWAQGADSAGSAEALTGLAALGEDVIPLLRAALADRDRQPAAQAALGRFQWLSALLQEPVMRAAETAARTIPAQAPQEHQVDLLGVLIRASAATGAGPLMVSDTLPAYRYAAATALDLRARLDAEYWAYAFSGLAAGDDTLDEALAPAPAVGPGRLIRSWAQLSRAGNLLARPRLPWPQAGLSPRCATPVAQYLAMLDQVGQSPPEYSYQIGFLLGQCRPLLDDHPVLIWETLVICCARGGEFLRGYLESATGNRDVRSSCSALAVGLVATWDRHHPGRGESESESLRTTLGKFLHWRAADEEIIAGEYVHSAPRSLLAQAGQIADPYLRIRALLRTIAYARATPLGLDLNVLVEEIADPQEKAQVIEWLLTSAPGYHVGLRMSEDFLDGLAGLFSQIADPENRALAQSRLALIVPGQFDDTINAAVASVGQIADPARRADAIAEIRSALGRLPSVAQALDAAADALPEAWLRNKARSSNSRLVAAYRDQYQAGPLAWRLPPEASTLGAESHRLHSPTGQLAWGTLYLNAVAAEAKALAVTPTAGSEAGWELLLGPEPEAGVDAIIESAADGGLRMSAVEASTINRVIQSGHAAALARLWPYLDSPDASAMAMIVRWASDDADVLRWKALVQLEAGYLTQDSIAPVVELLTSPADRLRLRAALALHGPRPYGNNRNRRWSVTRVGVEEALEALAELAIRADCPPSVLSILSTVQCDTQHDNAASLGRWLSAATAAEGTPAGWILDHLESIDDTLVDPLLTALPQVPPELQRTLLRGLARVASSTSVLNEVGEALRMAITAVPPSVRRDVRVVPQGAAMFLVAAAVAAAKPDAETRLQVARSIIEESRLWLDDECLSTSETCLDRLKAIGQQHYVHLDRAGYDTKATEAAKPLAENQDALRLLLAWVESLSHDADRLRHADLITALGAVAAISPIAFTALADPDVWEPILVEWVTTSDYWTGRLAAVRLLGLLRRVSDGVTAALRMALQDNQYVQRAAYAAAAEFRSMEGDVIPALLGLLADPSAAVAASTARLLASLAQGEGTQDRRRILQGLRDAMTVSPKAASVYLMHRDDGGTDAIEFIDRLDRILYRAIVEVSGV
jgi:hypothetical protein